MSGFGSPNHNHFSVEILFKYEISDGKKVLVKSYPTDKSIELLKAALADHAPLEMALDTIKELLARENRHLIR